MLRGLTLSLCLALSPALLAGAPPAWVQGGGTDPDTYPAAAFVTGYGLSSPGGAEADRRQEAMAMAREALASSIRTHITSEFTSRVTQQDKQMTRFAQNLVRTRADLELEGLDTFLTWQDDRRQVTHVLAVLEKARTLHLLLGQIERNAALCARTFESARTDRDASALLQARLVRERIEENLLVAAVLGGTPKPPACPSIPDIGRELRKIYGGAKDLDGLVATSALDLGGGLPRGIRVLMDRITYADTPFCGSFSAYLEQALSARLVAFGQVRIVDKAAARDAIREQGLDADLASVLRSQAVVRGTCFALGDEVKLTLRVTSVGGEELASTSVTLPAELLRKAGLKLVPDNFKEARQRLAIHEAQVQSSRLKVKVVLDRGDGGIYRKGDKLFLFLKANMDCYVKLLYQQVDGTQILIFPNRYHPDARILKDRVYQVPPDDNGFELVVEEPFGVEMVKVMASTEPIDVQGKNPDANGLAVVKEDLAALLGRTRGITLRKSDAQYAEDTAVLNTLAADSGSPSRKAP